MADFTIVVKGVDRLPNRGIIINTIREGLKGLCREAGKNLNILIDRGIAPKHGDLTVIFNRDVPYGGPGSMSIFGSASGSSTTINLDEHYGRRLERGVQSDRVLVGNRYTFAPDYTSQLQSLYEFNEPAFARFVANTALHEIGHLLGHKGSRNPMDIMYDSTAIPRQQGHTVKSNRRFLSRKAEFLTDRETMINAIREGHYGERDERMEWRPAGTPDGGIRPIKKKFKALGTTSSPAAFPGKTPASGGSLPRGFLLRRGSRGERVTALQRTLGVKADGVFGPNTERAVRDFQRRNNLRVDGIVGPQTRGRLPGGSSVIRTPSMQSKPLLHRGSRGAGVAGIQRTLGVKADGVFGPHTERAVRDFQRRNNLRVDGIVGPQTRSRLLSGSSSVRTPVPGVPSLLRRGSRGTGVAGLQRSLGIRADGIFGPKTEHAVRDFQRRHNLRVDGIVGPQTRGRLPGGYSTFQTPIPGASSLLRRGSHGAGVTGLQRSLGIRADGIFGPKTEHAVRDFQRRHNLRVDGIVGPQTRARLYGGTGFGSGPGATNPLRSYARGLR
ncbi:MAG: peptidoglycan-binding protein [Anaerolineales bacterium]